MSYQRFARRFWPPPLWLANPDEIHRSRQFPYEFLDALGLEIISVGIRDVILPGDMKDLMNKVTEAKKAAEANLIVRRDQPSVGAQRRPCAAKPTRPRCWRATRR